MLAGCGLSHFPQYFSWRARAQVLKNLGHATCKRGCLHPYPAR